MRKDLIKSMFNEKGRFSLELLKDMKLEHVRSNNQFIKAENKVEISMDSIRIWRKTLRVWQEVEPFNGNIITEVNNGINMDILVSIIMMIIGLILASISLITLFNLIIKLLSWIYGKFILYWKKDKKKRPRIGM